MKFNKIAIIGVGLIGGSIGLAIKKRRIAKETIGVFRHASTLKKALKARSVDKATMSIREGVKDADLIIAASPVHSIPVLVKEAARYARPGAIITDVGSTKSWIVGSVEKILENHSAIYFVGSHPMAGSEHAGVEYARADLLTGAPCIVTKDLKTDGAALKKVINFWKSLGAKVKVMSPAAHDRSVSLISHLPHIVAFGLAGAVPGKELQYAAEGFKDTTRVASSDPELWADIFLTNNIEVVKAGRLFEKYYKDILNAVSSGDYSKTVSILKRAKDKRDKFIYGRTGR
ncbi:MAG: prephenate dehydrogenase/arogenate dehydrogenase family protein [Candidatus Omnitrophota bacterium]|nr:prephenate dehydrogenase/arogenate dehydrogenase family protein [Candidatus Omnitrophota bacterium]